MKAVLKALLRSRCCGGSLNIVIAGAHSNCNKKSIIFIFFTLFDKGFYHGSDVRDEVHLNIGNFFPVRPKSLRSYWSETWHWSKLNSATKTKYIFSNWEVLQLKHFIVIHRSYNYKISKLPLVQNQAFVFCQTEIKY